MTRRTRPRLAHHRGGQVGCALALVVVGVAVIGPHLATHPNTTDYAHQLAPPGRLHWLGTDLAGRDQLARTAAGARASLHAVLVVFGLTTTIGLLIGGLSGYVRGAVDAVLSRVIDVLLGLPSLIIALAVVGALGVGSGHLVLAIVVSGWAFPAKITRSLVLASHHRLDVTAARMAGISRTRVFLTHVVPGTIATVLVAAATTIGDVVLALAGLSFLGLGAQPPTAELGQMLADSQGSLATAPWLLVGPGVMVVLTVAAAMLISDALRDTTDPNPTALRPRRSAANRAITFRRHVEPTGDNNGAALVMRDLAVTYPDGTRAVRGVSLAIEEGECLAVVGESGCGKTTLARAALGLLPPRASVVGDLQVGSSDVLDLPPASLRRVRGLVVGYVAQDPYAACDPLHSVGHHVEEAWRAHRLRLPDGEASRRVAKLGVDRAEDRLSERPHRWSGGMLQRATITAASVHNPLVTIADEPTSALDAELADDVLTTLRHASQSLLLVSHDLRLVAQHSDWVAVMYAGRIVETGPTSDITRHPRHPYTRALLAASPKPGGARPQVLPGAPPSPRGDDLVGCAFAARCPEAHDICHHREPELEAGVACWSAIPTGATT